MSEDTENEHPAKVEAESMQPADEGGGEGESSLKPLFWIGIFFIVVCVLFVLGNQS